MGKNREGWASLYVMRCMSMEEFKRYQRGEILRNLSTHQDSKTDAIGFCFFPVSKASETVEERIRYLAGIVSLDVVAVFATEPGIWLSHAHGWYRNPRLDVKALNRLEVATNIMTKKSEYCTTVYDKEMLSLVAYGTPYWMESGGWWIQWHKGGNRVRRIEDGT